MRRESVKLARLRRLYAKMRLDFLTENPWCAIGGCEATEIHHRAGRGAVTAEDYRIALRPDDQGDLDDVVVKDVEMFRAEMMDNRSLWMCCYLEGHERVNFWVTAKRGRLLFTVTEQPSDVPYEEGSL